MLSVLDGWDGRSIRFVQVVHNAAKRAGLGVPWSLGELSWSAEDEEFFFSQVSARDTRDRVIRRLPSGSLMLLVALFLKARRGADRGDFWRSVFEALDGTDWLIFRSPDTLSIHHEQGEAIVRAARNNGLRHESEVGGNRFVHTVQFQYGISFAELSDPKSLAWLRHSQVGSVAFREMLADERLESFRLAVGALQSLANGRSTNARFILEGEANPWLWFARDLVLASHGSDYRADSLGETRALLAPTLRWNGDVPVLEIAAGPIAPDAVSAGGDLYLGSAAVPLQPQADGTFWIPRDLRVPFDPNVFLGVVGESGWRAKPQWHASSLLANGYAVLRVGRPLDRTPIGDYSTGAELAVILSEGMHVKGRQLLRSVKLSGGFRAELHLLDEDAGIRILDEDGRDLQLLESRRPQRSPPSDLSMVVRASADKVCLGDWVTLEINWAMQSRASPRAVSLGEGFVPLVLGAPTGVMCVATARVRMPFDGQPSPRLYVRGRGPSGPWSESRLSLEHVDVFGSVITDERGSRPLYPHDPLCLNDAVRDFRLVLPADLRRFWGTSAPLPVFLGNRIVGELVEERVLFHKRERLLPFGEILVVDRDIIGSSPHVISSQPIGSGEVTSCELSADARITRVCLRRPLRLDRLNCTYRTADGSLFDAPMGEKGNLCDVFDIDNSKQGAPIELVLFDAERVHGTWSFSNKEIPGEATGVDVCWSLATGLPLRGRSLGVSRLEGGRGYFLTTNDRAVGDGQTEDVVQQFGDGAFAEAVDTDKSRHQRDDAGTKSAAWNAEWERPAGLFAARAAKRMDTVFCDEGLDFGQLEDLVAPWRGVGAREGTAAIVAFLRANLDHFIDVTCRNNFPFVLGVAGLRAGFPAARSLFWPLRCSRTIARRRFRRVLGRQAKLFFERGHSRLQLRDGGTLLGDTRLQPRDGGTLLGDKRLQPRDHRENAIHLRL